MNIIDFLPNKFEIQGLVVELKTATSFWMQFAHLIENSDKEEAAGIMLSAIKQVTKNGKKLDYEDLHPDIIGKIYEKIYYFSNCGKEPDIEAKSLTSNRKAKSSEKLLDYNKDLSAIYAAILQVYGVDLFECGPEGYKIEKIHWWKFKAMLDNLPPGNTFKDYYLHFRALKIESLPNKTDAEKKYKKTVLEIKKAVCLGIKKPNKTPQLPNWYKRSVELSKKRDN